MSARKGHGTEDANSRGRAPSGLQLGAPPGCPGGNGGQDGMNASHQRRQVRHASCGVPLLPFWAQFQMRIVTGLLAERASSPLR